MPAAVPACCRFGEWIRIFGGSPPSTSSHSAGMAISSPSLSRLVISASTVSGRISGSLMSLPRFLIVPLSASSRRIRFSSARSAFLRPNSRAISRVPTFPGCARMKATMASVVGKPLSRCLATLSACLASALLRNRFCRLRCRSLRRHRSARLAGGLRFRLCRRLLHRDLLGRPCRLCFRLGLGGCCAFGFLAPMPGGTAAFCRPFIDQRDRFRKRDVVRGLVARNRGVDAAGRYIGAVTAVLDRNHPKGGVIAQWSARIGAKAPAPGPLGDFFRDQRHGPVETDVEHLVASLEACIGVFMTHEGSEAAESCGDRLAGFGMRTNDARRRQQFERQTEVDVGRRDILRNARALRLFLVRVILLLAELDIGAKAPRLHDHVATALRILAQDAIGACFAVGGQRTGVTAFRVVGATDKGAEFSGLEVEATGAAARTLPGVAAVLARGVNVWPQHVVERIQHLGYPQVLDLVHRADEVAPEILQHLFPGNLVVRDAVELFFEAGGEIVFDVAREEIFKERNHDAAFVLAMQALLFKPDIAAVLQHLQNGSVGRRPADTELFHSFDERGFREARWRFGKMLGNGEFPALEGFALAHGGKPAAVLVLFVVMTFLVKREEAVELDHLAGRAKFEHT